MKGIAETHAQKADLQVFIDVSESFVYEVIDASCMPIPTISYRCEGEGGV